MTLTDILLAQLADPFRIGLLVFLLLTTLRTAHHTGRLVPLALGAAFVAVLIPTTFGNPELTMISQIGIGLVANVLILAVLYAIATLALRMLGGDARP